MGRLRPAGGSASTKRRRTAPGRRAWDFPWFGFCALGRRGGFKRILWSCSRVP